ncbi:MAG: hypothetical protein FWF81_09875 [Defluviitaleaceae bacterium]|nr:hypothetical protein [Defluviitaleaceae bacterium]
MKALRGLLITIVLLLFAACGGNSGESDEANGGTARNGTGGASATPLSMGRYVENDITPPIEGRILSLVAHDGTFIAFDDGLRTRFDSTDFGQTWTQSQGPGYGNEDFFRVNAIGIFSDGRLLVYLHGEGMTTIAPDGTIAHLPISEIDDIISGGDDLHVSLIHVLNDEQIMLTYSIDMWARFMQEQEMEAAEADENSEYGEYDEYDESGEPTTRIRTASSGNAVMGFMGNITAIFDVETSLKLQTLPHTEAIHIVGANANGDVYTIENFNIVRYGIGGDVDIILDSTGFAFGSPSGFVMSARSFEGGLIVSAMKPDANGMSGRLFKYFWDEDAFIDPAQSITIWSLEDNPFVRASIAEVLRNNPNAKIIHETALADDTAVTAADAIRTLNTRLLSGRGPDILILDGAPIESYASRNMLLDLTGRIDAGIIYENLIEPFVNDGQVNVIPMQFTIPMLLGEAHHLRQVNSLSELVQSIVSGNPVPAFDPSIGIGGIPEDERAQIAFTDLDELFEIMWQTSMAAFIYDNTLNSEALLEFLSAIQAISDKYELATDDTAHEGMFVISGGGGRANVVTGSLTQHMMQTTNLAAFQVGNVMLLNAFLDRASDMELFPGLVQGAWTPSTIVGISADTDAPDFAIEVVNTMLSMDVQSVNHGEGLPVLRGAIDAQIAQVNARITQGNEEFPDFHMPYFEIDMDALINRLQTPALGEANLREMVWNTTERLATGRINPEGAVQEIEQNIRNYLAERS